MYPKVEKEQLFQQLQSIGWSQVALEQVFAGFNNGQGKIVSEERNYLQEAQLFGSPFFQKLWQAEEVQNSRLGVQELLVLAMSLVNMPEELSGDKTETNLLLARIAPDLTPHDRFWKIFSRSLRQAFPADDFSQRYGNQKLKRQLHQFRYVISCQQAQWVRDHFREVGMTDAEALAAYFKANPGLPYSFKESSRLHNKAYVNPQALSASILYPDGQASQANIKILIDFHTEFILDQSGRFLNIIDPEGASQNGIVNGASFNYGERNRPGNQASHTRYDVKTPAVWDPRFRRLAIENSGHKFKSPQNNRGPLGYRSAKSPYARKGRSAQKQVKAEIARFKKLLDRPSVLLRFWAWFRQFWHKFFVQKNTD
ncbi:DUF3114 domain-containing protein [Streptococcus sanguinis]|uniref:DUF3114 domain-containing protein n=1 Tax=Streptococcus sanguinis TaxID=1305 RepID=A0A7H8V2W0_STRSA|nr:DUF3114 domain-containing protein [Streptococcus sanguinis]QLB50833.1 DUF3114 domain-containing protein [Streptococcus sanguinis]